MSKAKIRIPDLRFEESYRRAISPASGNWLRVGLITIRDQVLLPFSQGFAWSFILIGIRTWRVMWSQNGAMWGTKFKLWWMNLLGTVREAKPPLELDIV